MSMPASAPTLPQIDSLATALESICGPDSVSRDPQRLSVVSIDFSEDTRLQASLLVTPRSTQQIPDILRACHTAGVAVCVRGGGMSYTKAHVPAREGTLILDMSALNRVVEINTADGYITVETGITWKALYHALDGTGYHMPFGGTYSGERATVGGGLGNNCTAVKQGQAVDHLLGMEVVLADGRVIQTGGRATGRPGEGCSAQMMQQYGPDITGLFIHDAGILGVKTQATFRIERCPGGTEFACFGFNDTGQLIEAMVELCRQGLLTENGAFSEYHNRMLAGLPAPGADERKEMIAAVRKMAPSNWHALRYLLAMARPGGIGFLAKWKHSLSVSVDGITAGVARAHVREVKRLVKSLGGKVLPSTLSIVNRAAPFNPVERLIVGAGDNNNTFPSNRLTTLSNAHRLYQAAVDFFADNRDLMEQHGLDHTIIFMTVHRDVFGIEPIIYWRDAMSPLRASIVESARREELLSIPENRATREVAVDLRQRLKEHLNRIPGAHYQIGKYYPYMRDLVSDEQRELMRQLKLFFDPTGMLNPGGLGIEVDGL